MKLDDVKCFKPPQIGHVGSQWSPELSAALLRLSPAGWILVDHALRVIAANEQALELLFRGRGLRLAGDGTLTTELQKECIALARFVAGIGSHAGSAARDAAKPHLVRSGVGPPISVMGTRVENADRKPGDEASRVLLTVRELRVREARLPTEHALRLRFRLTAAQSKLARAFLQGKSLEEHSRVRGVSLLTTRTQLQQLLDKLGVRRQVDLLRVLKTFESEVF